MTTREIIYAVLVALGVILPMYYNLQYIGAGGNLLVDFFTVPLENAATASLLFDLLIAFAAFNVLLFTEGRRLGGRNFLICVAVSWLVAFAAGLPLFLLLRERRQRLGN
jgi:membrane-associated phospholipid phosphatase